MSEDNILLFLTYLVCPFFKSNLLQDKKKKIALLELSSLYHQKVFNFEALNKIYIRDLLTLPATLRACYKLTR